MCRQRGISIKRLVTLDKKETQDGDARCRYENKDVDVVVERLHCVGLKHARCCVKLDDADDAGGSPEHTDDEGVRQSARVSAAIVTVETPSTLSPPTTAITTTNITTVTTTTSTAALFDKQHRVQCPGSKADDGVHYLERVDLRELCSEAICSSNSSRGVPGTRKQDLSSAAMTAATAAS